MTEEVQLLSSVTGDWHMESDPRTQSRLAGNFNFPTVKQHDALHDRQPQASTSRSLGS